MFLSAPAEAIFVPSWKLVLAVGACRVFESSSYLGKVTAQNRLTVLIGVSALTGAVGGNFVNADLVIPTCDGEKVGSVWRRGEGKIGDGVSGRIGKRNVVLKVANSVACRCC